MKKYTDYFYHVSPHPGAAGVFTITETGYRGDDDYDNIDSYEMEGEQRAVEYAVNLARGTANAERVAVFDKEGNIAWSSPSPEFSA